MQLTDILARLKSVKKNGAGYQAVCPAHDDNKPSLTVSEKDGKILLHCHAGCTTEKILSAVGLEMKDLFTQERPAPSFNDKPKREIAAVYDYKDLNGIIVHSTIRYDPKSFSQRRPDPNKSGEYIWKEVFKGITPILYNLQAVTNAINEKRPVFIVEGEKDCETLDKLGFAATTCPMGAGKWHNHYSDTLKGSTVYIIADLDDTGRNHAQYVAKSLIGKADEINMIDLAEAKPESMAQIPKGWDISDLIKATPQEKQAAVIADLIAHSTPLISNDEESGNEGGITGGKKNAPELLINLVEASGANFFHSEVKDLYATIPVDNHVEVEPINSRDFELWLNGLFYRNTGKPISKDGVKQVLAVLSSKALYDNPDPIKLSTRVAEHDGAFWYDLSNKTWQAVKIDKDGWEIADHPPILFARYRHQLQQIIPKKGGDINKILAYVNIKESKTLFLCWLASCFIPNIPHAAVIIHGEKGAAKSTASGLLKSLIDPSALDTLTLQNDQRTMAVNLQNHWFLPFDNVSFINEETSDTLCRAITGGGIQQRRLNTNSEDTIFIFQRCFAINGIHNVATRADLLDRSILIELIRIADSDRRELSEVLNSFEADKADILGGIFDTVVKAMDIFPAVRLQNLPRMADFARWGYAVGEALGGLGQIFLDEYTGNRQIQNEEAIANDPVATLIVEFMKDRQEWRGLYSALYRLLVDMAEDNGISVKHKSFPANAIVLSKRITAMKSNLENVGIECVRDEIRKERGQYLSLKRSNSSTSSIASTEPCICKGLRAVDDNVDESGGKSYTGLSTAKKPSVYAGSVDNADAVDDFEPSRTANNICYVRESLNEAYQKCFGESLSKYNAKQKRADRKIDDYYKRLFGNAQKDTVATSSNKEKSFYEIAVGIGDKVSNPVGSADGDIAARALDEYAMGFSERNPNFYVFNSVMHLDEKTPHLHIDYVPIAGGYKNGMETRNSQSVALQQMGFGKDKDSINKWRIRERQILREICEKYGLEISEESKGRGKTLTPDEYKKMRDEAKTEMKADPDIMDEIKDEIWADIEDELLSEQQNLVDEISSSKKEIADADKKLAHTESRIIELTGRENDIKGRIKAIEDSGQILTLKQIEKLSPKIHAPVIGHRGIILLEDEYNNLKATAMAAAKSNEDANKWKYVARTAHETIRDIVRAVNLMIYRFMEADYPKAGNLTPEQMLLINSIRSHGQAIAKKFGYKKLAEEMKNARLDGELAEVFSKLLAEEQKKNKKSTLSFLEEAIIKARELESKSTPQPARKKNSLEL